MAQGTPDLELYFPAGLRLLEHRPVNGGETERDQARALLSGPQARISRLRGTSRTSTSLPGPGRPVRQAAPGTGAATGARRMRAPSSTPLPRTSPV